MSTAHTTLAAQVAEMQAGFATQLPRDLLDVLTTDQQRMAAEGAPNAAAPGTPMPDGELLDAHGNRTSLAATRAGRPAVVVFYRGQWCPYCNLTLKTYEEQVVPALRERDIRLIAVSPQKPDSSLATTELNQLTFDVVSDPGNRLATALGIRTAPSQESRDATGRMGLDLSTFNADGGYGLPMPTVALVDADGVIAWIDVHPNYVNRTEPSDILAAVARLP